MSQWPIPVFFQPDESISSWLVRAALAQGCDPLVLTKLIWPKWQVWSRDIDRGIDSDHLRPLCLASGISEETFAAAGLKWEVKKLIGHEPLASGRWPWVLTLGIIRRKRLGGLQYCPACLAHDKRPYFRRRWRYAWQTACLEHNLQLQDRCPNCKVPVEPHRLLAEDRHLAVCASCRFDLRLSPHQRAKDNEVTFQQTAEKVLREDRGRYGNQVLSVSEWFELVQFFINLIRRSVWKGRAAIRKTLRYLGIVVDHESLPVSGLAFELLPVEERRNLLGKTVLLLMRSPETLQAALVEAHVSVQAFTERYSPSALESIINSLPIASKSIHFVPVHVSGQPRSKREVMRMWARLQRKIRPQSPS